MNLTRLCEDIEKCTQKRMLVVKIFHLISLQKLHSNNCSFYFWVRIQYLKCNKIYVSVV